MNNRLTFEGNSKIFSLSVMNSDVKINCRKIFSNPGNELIFIDNSLPQIFAKMLDLRVLILQGNPVVSGIPQYRKTLILECVSRSERI